MSVEAISHIMRTHIPDGVAKLVAMVLADYADPISGRCWPKIPTLAAQCSQSERTVQRKLKLLEELGVLHVEPNLSGDRKGNVYVLHLPGAAREAPRGRGRGPRGGADTGGACEPATGDTQSPVEAGTGDSADTRRVTLLSPPRESTRESPRGVLPPTPRQRGARAHPKSDSRTDHRPGVPAPAALDPAAQARFQRLWAPYPEVGRLTANRDEALARFAALSPADQDRAVAAALIEARMRAEIRSAPLSLHHWLRKERWRNVELPAAAAGLASEARPSKVFVREGSAEWEAWAEHHRRLGRPMPTPIRFDSQRAEGWRFDSRLPPSGQAAEHHRPHG